MGGEVAGCGRGDWEVELRACLGCWFGAATTRSRSLCSVALAGLYAGVLRQWSQERSRPICSAALNVAGSEL